MRSDSLHYQAFVAVVDSQSISAAARTLGVPRPTLSRRLLRLEADLGVQLLVRSTRRILPTRIGERLYQRVMPLMQRFQALEQDLLDEVSEPSGNLRVSVPPLIAPGLAPLCAQLHERHPKLTVELVATLRFVDLNAEGFEVALRGGQLRDPSLVCRALYPSDVRAVATPTYLADNPPQNIEDLEHHQLLLGQTQDGRTRQWWPRQDGGRIRVRGRFVTNDRQLLKAMVLADQGIALLSRQNCGDALEDGRLKRVLPDTVGTTMSLYVVYAQRTVLPPRVRVFVDAAVAHFSNTPVSLFAKPSHSTQT